MQYLRPTTGQPVMWAGRRLEYASGTEFVLPVMITVTPERVRRWQDAIGWLRKWTMGGMRGQAGRDTNWVIVARYGTLGKWVDAINNALRREYVRATVVSGQGIERPPEQIAREYVQDLVLWLPEKEKERLAAIATTYVPWGMSPYTYLGRKIAKPVMGTDWLKATKRRQWLLRAGCAINYRVSETALYARTAGGLGATMVSPVSYAAEPETILDHLDHRGNWWPHGKEGTYGEADLDQPLVMWPTPAGPPNPHMRIKDVNWQAIKDRFQLPDRKDDPTVPIDPERMQAKAESRGNYCTPGVAK